MLFNAISIAALAAVASAAPWPASEPATYTTTNADSSKETLSTVTKTVSICSTGAHASGARSTGAAGTAAAAANLPTDLAAKLAKEMHAEISAVDKFKDLLAPNNTLLPQDDVQKRVVFDFNNAKAAPNATGGRILVASQSNFPILTDLGIAGAVAFLNPCSMNTPHVHPRATELLTVVEGQLSTGTMLENGFAPSKGGLTTQISAKLSKFQSTVFPQGSIHFQFNDNCEPATFVAALSSSDPGTSQVAQNFFFEDERIVKIALGEKSEISGVDLDKFRSQIPANLVKALDTCVSTCKAQGKM